MTRRAESAAGFRAAVRRRLARRAAPRIFERRQQRAAVDPRLRPRRRPRHAEAGSTRPDQQKLDQYLTGVRDIETRIENAERFGESPDPGCRRRPPAFPRATTSTCSSCSTCCVLAFQTDSTRLATFLLAHDGSNRPFAPTSASPRVTTTFRITRTGKDWIEKVARDRPVVRRAVRGVPGQAEADEGRRRQVAAAQLDDRLRRRQRRRQPPHALESADHPRRRRRRHADRRPLRQARRHAGQQPVPQPRRPHGRDRSRRASATRADGSRMCERPCESLCSSREHSRSQPPHELAAAVALGPAGSGGSGQAPNRSASFKDHRRHRVASRARALPASIRPPAATPSPAAARICGTPRTRSTSSGSESPATSRSPPTSRSQARAAIRIGKPVCLFRQSLDPDSAYADAALHGDGLTSLAIPRSAGALTHEIQSNVSGPRRLRIEKRGNVCLDVPCR